MKQLFIVGLMACLACSTRKASQQVFQATSDSTLIQTNSHPLNNKDDLQTLLDQIGNSRIVLLGEASHGTSEFYYWRAEISKYLIQQKDFKLIAVEGDWSEAFRVNQFIKGNEKDSSDIIGLFKKFNRWPTWLWANQEMIPFVQWLNNFNQFKKEENKIGFYGLDLFSIGESLQYLNSLQDLNALTAVKKMQHCFQPFNADPYLYSSVASKHQVDCSKEASNLWLAINKNINPANSAIDNIVIAQNARVALNGEKYLRVVTIDRALGWNIREQHMLETVKDLLRLNNGKSKIIIWAHNTHIGDAHYTDMGSRGKTNLGELLRSTYGEANIFIIGFGSYAGTVAAVEKWGTEFKQLIMPPPYKGSWEDILHQAGNVDKFILLKNILHTGLNRWIDQRAIGIVYRPKTELNYVPSIIPRRYDAFVYIDHTTALHPVVSLSDTSVLSNAGQDY